MRVLRVDEVRGLALCREDDGTKRTVTARPVATAPVARSAGARTPPAYCTESLRFSIPTMLSGGSENTWATRSVSGWR